MPDRPRALSGKRAVLSAPDCDGVRVAVPTLSPTTGRHTLPHEVAILPCLVSHGIRGIMPAVDSPYPGGLDSRQLIALLAQLAPGAVGASVTVFDPDLDPDGRYARLVTNVLLDGLSELGSELDRDLHN